MLMRKIAALSLFILCAAYSGPVAAVTLAVSAGANHSMALKADGSVRSWGDDTSGQLGSGRSLASSFPTAVPGLSGVVTVASGDAHVLALKSDGTVWAWGGNGNGQLGDGTTTTRSTPVAVTGLSGVIAIAAGSTHSVALKNDGSVWTWGTNYEGQLGVNSDNCSTPIQVPGVTATAISAKAGQTFALRNDGRVLGWGKNDQGQLGDGSITPPYTGRFTPMPVSGLAGVAEISAGGNFALARKFDGTIWSWGANASGQLGNGTATNSLVPVQVNGLNSVTALSAGWDHSLVLRTDGSVWAWGGNGYGQLGDGTYADRPVPVPLAGLPSIVAVSTGFLHSVVVANDGTVWSWGANQFGQLGDYTTTGQTAPILSAATGVTRIAVGDGSTVALKRDGTVLTWGDNSHGQLGNGARIFLTTPATVSGFTGAAAIAAGGIHSVALKSDGTVWAWGNNDVADQLGDGTGVNRSVPGQVPGLSGITAIAAGYYHTLALKAGGSVLAWGYNFSNQLGTGVSAGPSSLIQVNGVSQVTAISAGDAHSVALEADGSVWTWGANDVGQLGDGSVTGQYQGRAVPQAVPGLTRIVAIAAGGSHTLALRSDGTLWAWGSNYSGQLGDGTTTDRAKPVQVAGFNNVVTIAAGENHSVAVTSDGTVWAWGVNYDGRLGNGSTQDSAIPVAVIGLNGVAGISGGGSHTLARKADGTVWSWGPNDLGQLGDGTEAMRVAPVVVLRENGTGSLQANDWFLDLNPALAKVIPSASVPPFLVLTTASGSDAAQTVIANVKFNAVSVGQAGAVFITAQVPAGSPLPGVSTSRLVARSIRTAAQRRQPASGGTTYTLIQLTPAGWQPVVNGQLTPFVTGVLGDALASQTILRNTDTTRIPGATFCLGYGTDAASMLSGGTIRSVASISGGASGISASCIPGSLTPQSGLWWNPAEGGRGYTLEFSGGKLFMAAYLYDASGRSTWYGAGPAMKSGSNFSAPMTAYSGGQTLTGAYRSPAQGMSPGTLSINFSDATHGTMTWPGGTIPITRYEFTTDGLNAPPSATQPQTGWWWNPAEGGRGFSVEVQNGMAFIASYMYDGSGNPVWYASGPAALTANNTYQGSWSSYTGGQTLTGAYHSANAPTGAGSITIQFTQPAAATMTLPDGRQIPLQRFGF